MSNIIVRGAREGNLKDISLEIPREKLIVFTGLSGSGKTTLAIDVIFQECQRQYLEAMGLQGINKPKIDFIHNVSPAVIITQNESNKNPRSTVGTLTDIYTDLRMVYEKLGVRVCPKCNKVISAAECKEEVEKTDEDFKVFMYCSQCGYRMEKLTRTYFSCNTREGACTTCEGLGKVLDINKENVANESLSLEDGAIDFWEQKYKEYQISSLYNAFRHYGIPFNDNTPVADFSNIQKAILYQGVESEEVKKAFSGILPPKTVAGGRFEGVFPTLWRRMSDKGGEAKQLNDYFNYDICPDCRGERLGALSRSVTVESTRLPELSLLSLEELYTWIQKLEDSLTDQNYKLVEPYLMDLKTKIQRILNVGLGYLSLDRQTITLSGGELQRVKLAATLDSDLTGIIYIMDEPTIGLHPKDTEGMITILKKLRDLGNTVIVIEHDPDIMQAADYIVDIGPGSGKHGGEIIGTGTLDELKEQEASVTGTYLRKEKQDRKEFRKGTGNAIKVENANLYNLKNIGVSFPIGCLNTVTGVSGSGKSTLVFEVLAEARNKKQTSRNVISGMEQFDQIVTIEQSAITKMKRSNIATYSEVYTEVRKIFGSLKEAKDRGLSAKHFSFNTPGGRCENCEGLGYVTSNMLFFKDIEVTCPVCGGKQFSDDVLSVKYKDCSIKDILQMSVEEAFSMFHNHPKIERILKLLEDVGLGYLELGQSLTTLSGGEGQRLKLAKELINNNGKHSLYLMDEPTTGLHPIDVENFLTLLNRMVDSGNTVIVVEHNQQVIKASDWITDLGPEGGINGGKLVFAGTPSEMLINGETITAEFLRKSYST
ncbi:ABC transporter related [Desulfofarcimen acetoxidans DSM 771]|uniref:UvrABC system protein A n=1 Tax=Desulfofarcimen acetoxidans (strain ATCC 49208 / DSM 771 / KCTC 5769 / VKM B-1644 / 5575) TaxID=485916 RepID=C8VVR7_DESAS|nr:excinuclease ABC subunit UvrA [Desulfofarcimen acetoxidans]ACV62382.1 ABC transporter related [Desulfofarcimen acetoxidans DSM 771]